MMFQNKVPLMLVLMVANLTLVACSDSGDTLKNDLQKPKSKATTKQFPKDSISGYSEASCLYGFSEGPQALSKSSPVIQNTFFNKNIDASLLNPVLAASSAEVVRFAQTTGVRYYKTTARSSEGCLLAGSLPDAPYDLEQKFAGADGGSNSILGLYLGIKTPGVYSTDSEGAITVRADSNKWVLVHEYMHHLFELQATAEGIDVPGLQASVRQKMSDFEGITTTLKSTALSNQPALVKDAATKLKVFLAEYVIFIRQYYLEEMTIESVLADKLNSGQLKLVLDKQRINGAYYTIDSAKKSLEILNGLQDGYRTFKYSYGSDLVNSSEAADLAEVDLKIEKVKSEVNDLAQKAKYFIASKGLESRATYGFSPGDSMPQDLHVGCSHSQLPADLIESAINLKEKIK